MANQEELDKMFEAALHGRKAPSRFGTPEEQVVAAPVAFQKATPVFQKADDAQNSSEASPFQAAASDDVATELVTLDDMSLAALDENVNEEFEGIIDKKIAKEKARKRRDRMFAYVALIAIVGGTGGWLYKNPEKRESISKILVEIRTAIDPTAQAAKYDESLEKIGEHGNALDDASAMLGVEKGEGGDESMDKEMQQLAGEKMGGLSAEEKKKKLDALGKKVTIKKKDEKAEEKK